MSSAFSKSSVFFCPHVHAKNSVFEKFHAGERFQKVPFSLIFPRIRVDGSRIRKEKVVFSNGNGNVWTGPKSYSLIHTNVPRKRRIPKLSRANCELPIQPTKRAYHMCWESNAHEQCVTRMSCFLLVPPGRPARVITWQISTLDPGITLSGSQLTRRAGSVVI